MKVQRRHNGVNIYCLSDGPTIPEWLSERGRRNLSKNDIHVRRRIELLQDFNMPIASTCIRQSGGIGMESSSSGSSSGSSHGSSGGRYIFVSGTYRPRIRCYDVNELSMKFERYLDSEVRKMEMLNDDYGKIALLLDDRTIEFHAPYGTHTKVRLPYVGQDMKYESSTCELLIVPSITSSSSSSSSSSRRGRGGGVIYRLQLDEGRFNEPWTLMNLDSNNNDNNNDGFAALGTCIYNHRSQPLACIGCTDGCVRFYDNRTPDTLTSFAKLNVKSATYGYGYYHNNNHNNNNRKRKKKNNDNDNDDFAMNHNNISTTIRSFQEDGMITSIGDDGDMLMCVGTSNGIVALYDVRSQHKPLYVQEHRHGLPIHTCRFHYASNTIVSADSKIIKIWKHKNSSSSSSSGGGAGLGRGGNYYYNNNDDDDDYDIIGSSRGSYDIDNNSNMGSIVTNIESTSGTLCDFIIAGDETNSCGDHSGLIMCASDQSKMETYYVPALGIAPKWCSFLDGITEELDETNTSTTTTTTRQQQTDPRGIIDGSITNNNNNSMVYANYKFVTRDELETLGISNLIGTSMLRGYMHGFFIDNTLYQRVRAVANPFEYEEYQKQKIRDKLEQRRKSRITPTKNDLLRNNGHHDDDPRKSKEPTVNPELIDRLERRRATSRGSSSSSKASKVATRLLEDDRFQSLFHNPDYEIDEDAEEFRLRNPSGVSTRKGDDVDGIANSSSRRSRKRRSEEEDSDDDDYNTNDAVTTGADNDDEKEEEEIRWHQDDDSGDDDDDNNAMMDYDSIGGGSSSSSDDDDNEDGFKGGKVRGEAYNEMKSLRTLDNKNNNNNNNRQQLQNRNTETMMMMKKKNNIKKNKTATATIGKGAGAKMYEVDEYYNDGMGRHGSRGGVSSSSSSSAVAVGLMGLGGGETKQGESTTSSSLAARNLIRQRREEMTNMTLEERLMTRKKNERSSQQQVNNNNVDNSGGGQRDMMLTTTTTTTRYGGSKEVSFIPQDNKNNINNTKKKKKTHNDDDGNNGNDEGKKKVTRQRRCVRSIR